MERMMASPPESSRARLLNALAATWKVRYRHQRAFLVIGRRLRLCPSQRFRCDFDRHSTRSDQPRTACIRLQTEVLVQAHYFGGVLASTHRSKRRRHVEDGSLASLKTE